MMIFLGAFIMVFFAEMGDKSQLLAMALATRYNTKQVLLGVILATLFNNGLAVLMGYYLSYTLHLAILQLPAALSFIAFGIWKLREKENPESQETASKEDTPRTHASDSTPTGTNSSSAGWGKSLLTVTLLLFLSEIGDKTQLATVAYVIKYSAPLRTLLGVIAGMTVADALGIFAGAYLSRIFTARTIRYTSASVFILIGLVSLYLFW